MIVAMVLFLVFVLAFVPLAAAQSIDEFLHDVPTRERIQQPGWWPTKSLHPKERAALAGWQTCAKCHASIASAQRQSEMAHALMTVTASTVLGQHAHDSFRLGSYQYAIDHSQENTELSVSDGSSSLSAGMQWAFGSGEVGRVIPGNGREFSTRAASTILRPLTALTIHRAAPWPTLSQPPWGAHSPMLRLTPALPATPPA